jgi:hypothetical protein
MIARKKSSKSGQALPTDWIESLNRLLNETYNSECKEKSRYFDVYGQVFSEELLLVISYLSEKDEYLAPITLFLSSDALHLSDESKVKVTQKNFIEIAGLFFDEIFSSDDWNEFEPNWQEVIHDKETYHYKISRENLNATIEANKLLGEDFEDIEFDEDLDQ